MSKRLPIPSQNYDLSNEHYIFVDYKLTLVNTEMFMILKTCVIERVLIIIYSLWNHTASASY